MNIKCKDSQKDYLIIVNRKVTADRAKQLGYDNVIVFRDDFLDNESLSALKEAGKTLVLAFDQSKNTESFEALKEQISRQGIRSMVISDETGNKSGDKTEDKRYPLEKLVEQFPTIPELESLLLDRKLIDTADYLNYCGNCHASLREGDKYCDQCGTERGKGAFRPFENTNEFYCVYGPPIKAKFKCSACNHTWVDGGLGGYEAHYCPQCGKKTVRCVEKQIEDFFSSEATEDGEDPC